jgi:catechol 2,3-dioxygenase-like lactoylglutathione lyase family enzyme
MRPAGVDAPRPQSIADQPSKETPLSITGLFHTGMTVSNLDRSLDFYGRILGIDRFHSQVSDQPYLSDVTGLANCSLRIGFGQVDGDTSVIEILEYAHPKGRQAGVQFGSVGSPHVCWEVDDLPTIFARLCAAGVESLAPPSVITEGPWRGARAAFLVDPDGLLVELIEPAGRGGGSGRLVRMAHTGFIVKDLDVALEFLTGMLGLSVVDRYTGESAYLHQVGKLDDSFMRATWLSVPDTEYVLELWELSNPRLPPADMFPPNVGSNHFCFLVKDIWAAYKRLSAAGVEFAGPPATSTAGINSGGQAIYFVGPDGIRYEFFQGRPTMVP